MADNGAPIVIFVLGGPGAGKGTQCANLVKDFKFLHLSAGDLLRAEMAREGSEFGELIATHIKEGKIVPKEVTLKLIQDAMARSPGSMILLDGFPRKMDQALEFERVVAPCKAVLYFTCTEEAMQERLLKRGETSGRSDDNKESIVKRFHTFKETSLPVIRHYQAENKVIEIDTLDTPDNVYLATKAEIQQLLGLDPQASTSEPATGGASEVPPTETFKARLDSESQPSALQAGNAAGLSSGLKDLSIDLQPETEAAPSALGPLKDLKPKEVDASNPELNSQPQPEAGAGQPGKVPTINVEAPVVANLLPHKEETVPARQPAAQDSNPASPQPTKRGEHRSKKASCVTM